VIDTLHVQGLEHLPEALEQAAVVLRYAIERQEATEEIPKTGAFTPLYKRMLF